MARRHDCRNHGGELQILAIELHFFRFGRVLRVYVERSGTGVSRPHDVLWVVLVLLLVLQLLL